MGKAECTPPTTKIGCGRKKKKKGCKKRLHSLSGLPDLSTVNIDKQHKEEDEKIYERKMRSNSKLGQKKDLTEKVYELGNPRSRVGECCG